MRRGGACGGEGRTLQEWRGYHIILRWGRDSVWEGCARKDVAQVRSAGIADYRGSRGEDSVEVWVSMKGRRVAK